MAQKAAEASKEENLRLLKEKEEFFRDFNEKARNREKQALSFFSKEFEAKNNEKALLLRNRQSIKEQEFLL